MKIAIVDDISYDRTLLSEKLLDYAQSHRLDFEIVEFGGAEAFLDAFKAGVFSLVFMDIFMGGMSGMDAAIKVFEKDKNCKIIFLTITRDFAVEGYTVRAVSYLVKPIDDAAFLVAMSNCKLRQEEATAVLNVVSGGAKLSLPIQNILYIDYKKHVTYVHMENGVIKVNESFRDVTEPLGKLKSFIICLRGTMVNLNYVERQEGHTFVLKNGEVIPMSIRNKNALGATFRRFVYEESGGLL